MMFLTRGVEWSGRVATWRVEVHIIREIFKKHAQTGQRFSEGTNPTPYSIRW